MNLSTPIEYVKGVGPQRGEKLQSELGVLTCEDLLNLFPFRYNDRSQFHKVNQLHPDMPNVQIIGKLRHIQEFGKPRQRRLSAKLVDETGTVELVWFKGVQWVKKGLKEGVDYVLFGKPSTFKGKINFAHPELEPLSKANAKNKPGLEPVYSTTEKLTGVGLHSKGLAKLIKTVLDSGEIKFEETMSNELMEHFKLIDKTKAYHIVHQPTDSRSLQIARYRLKFEELFFVQMQILRSKLSRQEKYKGFVFERVGENFNNFYQNHLPFELTGAQKRVMKELRRDLGKGEQMNRLLQGDVGSGKTMVALLTMLIAIDNGYQCAMIAPTEILANQHYITLQEQLEGTGINVDLLTGSIKKSDRKPIHEKLEAGETNILVGTHALLEDTVRFANLGIVVIDEQHRFGVAQRSKMWRKNTKPPHVLVMSATPIPRTLAMTLYGDLSVSVIDELPPGRKPIETIHKRDQHRLEVFGFLKREIEKGRQVYIVYPLIEESAKMDYKDLMDGYEAISRTFPPPDYRISIVHGKMKAEDKDYEMQQFVDGNTQIMVATTVIEVGVNVPNASVMVIESAERFGLSQLHQLRGRVGRGAEQSYCVLMTGNKLSAEARKRMETMVRTQDGFEVAEVDLELRGPGDIMGTQQSGVLNLQIADLAKDGKLLQVARHAAIQVLKEDPNLKLSQNSNIAKGYAKVQKERPNWGRIS